MLTGKQRSYLKSLSNGLDTTVYIGKNELTDTVLGEMADYLRVHELVKVKVQDNVDLPVKELANEAARALKAEYVQAIGRRFVLYKKSDEAPVIVLPR
ncbi:MAG: YhbY family RNA-binding protein [Firmicutes bacterium]|nr:YhbY family RNA-binding protein [Bacillota bacterium]